MIMITGLPARGEQSRATVNPCVEPDHRNPRLLPVDEALSQAEFFQYRVQLRAAVDRRDVQAVLEAVDPDIRLGFDASGGREALRTRFVDRSALWEELRVVLALGGSFSSPSSFAAPYVYSTWPDQLDSFECAAITGRNVRLRSAPRLDGPIIASLSYSMVRVIDDTEGRVWVHVQLGDGRTGYMWHAYVRRPIDYRALFNLIDGRWRMTAFVAGD
jgi:hypothetical protein